MKDLNEILYFNSLKILLAASCLVKPNPLAQEPAESKSTNRVLFPEEAKAIAKLIAVVVLPTLPLRFAIAIILPISSFVLTGILDTHKNYLINSTKICLSDFYCAK